MSKKLLHILFVPSWYPKDKSDIHGCFFREQALALIQAGHKVGVISPQMRSLKALLKSQQRPSGKMLEIDEGIATIREAKWAFLPRIPYGNSWIFVRSGLAIFNKYKAQFGTPDVLHAHSMLYGGFLAAKISRSEEIHFVITEHSSGFLRQMTKKWQDKIAIETSKMASGLVAVSESFSERLGEQTGMKWGYIPNVLSKSFEDSGVNAKRALAGNFFIFCIICNLNTNKNVNLAIVALSMAAKKTQRLG